MKNKLKRVTIKDLREYLIKNLNYSQQELINLYSKDEEEEDINNKAICVFCDKKDFVSNFKYNLIDETLNYIGSVQSSFGHYWLPFCTEECMNIWLLQEYVYNTKI